MLNRPSRSSQRGITLFLALVVLVAMLLSGIALFRSVDSGVLVAGNIAMQKSATRQGDQGTEAAITNWLVANATGTVLHTTAEASGYSAHGLNEVPGTSQTWAQWWDQYRTTFTPVTLAADTATGNTVSYFIQRLCTSDGEPFTGTLTCVGPPQTTTGVGSSKGAGVVALARSTTVYYRITSRIVGPGNAVSFIQTVVSM